jgi:hypothetical protein
MRPWPATPAREPHKRAGLLYATLDLELKNKAHAGRNTGQPTVVSETGPDLGRYWPN